METMDNKTGNMFYNGSGQSPEVLCSATEQNIGLPVLAAVRFGVVSSQLGASLSFIYFPFYSAILNVNRIPVSNSKLLKAA